MIARLAWIICCTVVCALSHIHAFTTRRGLDVSKVLSRHIRVISTVHPPHNSDRMAIATNTGGSPSVELFLSEEVGLSSRAGSIMIRYPGLASLSVNSNLRPTMNVFTEFGFAKEDIAQIIHNVPVVMAHDAGLALPEKLAALQRMYQCTTPELVELTKQAPFILTTSIDKNTRIADFFRNTVQLSPKQILQIMRIYPAVATAKVDILRRCWALLTRLYGFDEDQARRIIIDCPMVLSERMVNNIKDRLVFLSSEFDVQSFPCPYIKALTLKFPSFLYLDYDNKIGPNLAILRELLRLDANGITEKKVPPRRIRIKKPKGWESELFLLDDYMVSGQESYSVEDTFIHTKETDTSMQTSDLGRMLLRLPNLLKYMPSDLRKICSKAMRFLSGEVLFSNSTPTVSRFKNEEQCAVSDNSVRVVEQYNNLMLGGQFDHTLRNDELSASTDSVGTIETICDISDVAEDGVLEADSSSRDVIEEWLHSSTVHNSTQGHSIHDLIYDIVHNCTTANDNNDISSINNDIYANTGTTLPTLIPINTTYPFAYNPVAVQHFVREASHLTLSVSRACTAIRNSPGILVYRTQRSQGVVAALTVSLGLSRTEVSKMVSTYYRLLALSVDGKLRDVLRVLAEAAVRCLAYTTTSTPHHNAVQPTPRPSLQDQPLPAKLTGFAHTQDSPNENDIQNVQHTLLHADIELYRSHPVRTMVREMVIRYPHILGSSLDKITERFAWAASENAPWDAYLACWRMSDQKYYTAARRVPKTRVRKP